MSFLFVSIRPANVFFSSAALFTVGGNAKEIFETDAVCNHKKERRKKMELTNTHSIIRGYSITSDGVHIEYYIRWVLRLAPGKEKQNGSAAHPVAGKV